ncbi:MAG: hypothetical protein IT379_41865 [Deltaproteobacteria bacterium]|nr:hypothetical protein [Deltaproteobacteria bacterium]
MAVLASRAIATVVAGLALAGCTDASAPDGVLVCTQPGETAECPSGMRCGRALASEELRCFREVPIVEDAGALDASMDADATRDAGIDATHARDAGPVDAGPRDTGADARFRDMDPPEIVDGGAPVDGWPACDAIRRTFEEIVAATPSDLEGEYCVQRRADRLVVACFDTPEDCTCEGHERLPEEFECVLRPPDLRCFRFRRCRSGANEGRIGCYSGNDRCWVRYLGIIACEEVPLSPDEEACVPPEEVARSDSGARAIARPGWGCCWE